MRYIKINFVDFWEGFDYKNFFLYQFLSGYYNLEVCDKPDYLFCSCYGYNHWKYKECIKIYYTPENIVPDFNIYDYCIGFHYLLLDDRYFRFPLWLMYCWNIMDELNTKILNKSLFKRKFCNFIYSNNTLADPYRERFFYELSKYKKVDSGGKFLNNIGYFVNDKLNFIKEYKFSIAIENSCVNGYTTEKIIEPIMVNSIPIYYGDPSVSHDFNLNSLVDLRSFASISQAVEYIVALDENEDLYLQKYLEPWFQSSFIKEDYCNGLYYFFKAIIDSPIEISKRIVDYGFAVRYRKEMSRCTPLVHNYIFEKIYGFKDRIDKYK